MKTIVCFEFWRHSQIVQNASTLALLTILEKLVFIII